MTRRVQPDFIVPSLKKGTFMKRDSERTRDPDDEELRNCTQSDTKDFHDRVVWSGVRERREEIKRESGGLKECERWRKVGIMSSEGVMM